MRYTEAADDVKIASWANILPALTTAGTCIYGINMAGGYIPGDTVLVIGPGPIGLMSVQICKALGAGKVILSGTREERLELGKKLGADHIINVRKENLGERVYELTDGLSTDLVLEAAGGKDSLQQALESTRKGGKITILAFYKEPVTADISIAVRNGINIYTVRGEGNMSLGRALALMAQGRISGKPLITHTFPIEKINEAFKTFVERIDGAMKLGIVHFKAFPEVVKGEGPVIETLKKIVEDDFFTAVEVGMLQDVKVRNEARKLLEVSHMEVCYATQPKVLTNKLNLNAFDPVERRKAVETVKSCIDEAYDLGASWVRLISGKDPGDEKREQAKRILIDSITEICEYARGRGRSDSL